MNLQARRNDSWLIPVEKRQLPQTPQFLPELLHLLDTSGVPRETVCLVGSSCLAYFGVRLNRDLDLTISGSAELDVATLNFPPEMQLVAPFTRYGSLGLNAHDIHTEDFSILTDVGVRMVRPEVEFAYKARALRARDVWDLPFLEVVANRYKDWSWGLFISLYEPPRPKPDPTRSSGQKTGFAAIRSYLNKEAVTYYRAARNSVALICQTASRLRPSSPMVSETGHIEEEYVDVGEVVYRIRAGNPDMLTQIASANYLAKHVSLVAEFDPPHAKLFNELFFDDMFRDKFFILSQITEDYEQGRWVSWQNVVDPGASRLEDFFHLMASINSGVPKVLLGSLSGGNNEAARKVRIPTELSKSVAAEEFEILARTGVIWPMIVWPTAIKFVDFIETKIQAVGNIVARSELNLTHAVFLNFCKICIEETEQTLGKFVLKKQQWPERLAQFRGTQSEYFSWRFMSLSS